MRLAQDCVGAWVVGISPPTVLGWFPRLAPTRAPPLRPATPCHYLSGNRPATRRRPDGRGSGDGQHVVARGEVGGGWALAGARPRGAARCMGAPKLPGREDLAAGTNKSRRATIKAHPSAPPHLAPMFIIGGVPINCAPTGYDQSWLLRQGSIVKKSP